MSAGIITPPRVYDGLLPVRNEFSCNEVKRVSGKSRSMAHWSSEIEFLKLLPLGCGPP